MRSLHVLALLIALLAGCVHGVIVRREDTPSLGMDEGLVVLVGDTNGRLAITLCRDADMLQCVDLGPVSTTTSVVSVAQVPTGRYCLMAVSLELVAMAYGIGENYDEETARCFEVAPGEITYPGTLVFQTRPTEYGAWELVDVGWARREDTLREQLAREMPNLHGFDIRSARHSPFRR